MGLTFEGTSRSVQAGKHRIHYHEAGEGPPLVMIHGGGPGASGWGNYQRNIDVFAQNHRVLIPDLPGFAKSEKVEIRTSLYRYHADAIRAFMDAVGVEKAHIVGNSLGGAITLAFALDTPDRADRLILMGPGGGLQMFSPFPSEGVKHLFTYYEGEGPTEEKLDRFLDCMVYDRSMITPELFQARLEASKAPGVAEGWPFKTNPRPILDPIWRDLDKVQHKTLLIWGRDDRTVMLDNSFIMLNQIPNVRLLILGKTGHWVQWERADEFNRFVSGFLESND